MVRYGRIESSMVIFDKIAECDDGKPRARELVKLQKLVIHKIGKELGGTGPEIAAAFRDTSKYAAGSYTGGQHPYTFIIRVDGSIDQCLGIKDTGPHAKRWNSQSVSVALIGDFTKHPPTDDQWLSLIELCIEFASYGLTIHGHTELPGSSSDPKKACPGPLLDLDLLRSEVAFRVEERRLSALLDSGVRL